MPSKFPKYALREEFRLLPLESSVALKSNSISLEKLALSSGTPRSNKPIRARLRSLAESTHPAMTLKEGTCQMRI
ncbi:MAG: hypothetical protein Q4E67_07070 [Planctomycetia bacterium]|nr:hypothetical protein [Planctomycetia bacterium]